MIYLSYLRHLNLVGGNFCIASMSFAQLATNGEINVGRDDSSPVSQKNNIWSALNVPFLWESPVPSQVPFYTPGLKWFTCTCLPRWCHQGSWTWSWISARSGWSIPTYCQGIWCDFSPGGYMKPKIPPTTVFEEYGHLHTGRQATEWRLFSRKGDLSWWMKGIFSSRGSWFPCNQMATGSWPNFASWPCSSVMITTDWTQSLAIMRILNIPEWFLKIIRLVQHPGQHLTTELVEKWEAEINRLNHRHQ